MRRFGEKLRQLRQRHKMTLREAATAFELSSHSHVSNLESGRKKPSAELVFRIAQFFNVSTDQLMNDELELD